LTYNGNQLKKVTDQCADLTYTGAMDFKDGANKTVEYLWDANGNMTRDRNKKIWKIKYNVLNLPERIEYMDGHIVLYTYASDGRKLKVEYQISNVGVLELNGIDAGSTMGLMGGGTIPFNPPGPLNPPGPIVPPGPTTYLTMDYCGKHVYRNGVLERTMNDYGYQADSTYYYYIKDYQGNMRAVIDQNGALKEINNYYPYGGLMGAASTGVQPNKYGCKELDRQNGIDWYDFEARYQDPMLPMFTTIDPLAEKAPGISPYAYCAGNPVRYIDPSGNEKLNFFDKEEDPILYKWAQMYKDDAAIHVFAHGDSNGTSIIVKDKGKNNVVISTADDFADKVLSKSKTWNNLQKSDSPVIIIIHGCNTGKEKESFAKKLSSNDRFHDVKIIAPNEEIGVNKDSKSAEVRHVFRNKEGKVTGSKNGRWNVFQNGTVIKSFDYNWTPKYKPTIWDYLIHF
jgi:RHS repeat-associated protein